MRRPEIIDLHNLVSKENEKTYIDAGKYVLDMAGQKNVDVRPDQGKAILTALFHSFLDTDQYIEAALLAWGNIKFNPEPEEVKRIWDLMLHEPFGIILGSGSVGKTYNGVIFTLLNWCRDPEYTNSKMISTVEGHTKANSWSTLVEFHKDAIISMPGMEPTSNTLVLRPRQLQSAIAIVAIPQSDDGKGRLQGFHPLPRRKPDPILGRLSRVNVFIDEAEKVPGGLWVGIDNLQTARTEEGSVRVTAVTNPEDVTSPLAQRAEPPNGWDSIDIDEDFEWTSRMGWKVIRLDAAQSENVKQKKVVYPGLQTYDGYQGLTRLGVNHPRYYTFGRGFYPRANIQFNIVPPGYLANSKAIYNFTTVPINVASLDPAFADGGDEAVLTTGRYGLSDGLLGGKRFNPPKMAVQYEQQFPLEKGNTLLMADTVMMMLRNLKIKPEHFIMDKTGNALGLHDVLRLKYGDIYGVSWGTEATTNKILLEDTEVPKDLYKLIVTEMWFAFAHWLEYEHVMFSPIMDTHRLFGQLTARKYSPRGRRRKVESKIEFKFHSGGKSPDEADSAIMLVHLCRLIDHERPTMIPQARPTSDADWNLPASSKLDENSIPFIEFND